MTTLPLLCELHAHTTWSDGSMSPRELVDLHGRAGFAVLAITDHAPGGIDAANHDRYLAELDAEAARALDRYGLLVLPGLELTMEDPDPTRSAHAVAVGLPPVANGDVHLREHVATRKTMLPCEQSEPAVVDYLRSGGRVTFADLSGLTLAARRDSRSSPVRHPCGTFRVQNCVVAKTVPTPARGKEQRPERERILNRELSALDLNQRVLELAADPDQPLLERVNFCAIVSSNLDEFFSIRVAGLLDQAASGLAVRSPDGRLPQEALDEIRDRVLAMTRAQSKLWASELGPGLAAEGIAIGSVEDLSKRELEALERRFEREVFPVLTPLGVGPGQPFPFISPLSLSLGLFVVDPTTEEERFARLKVPEGLPRFVSAEPGGGTLLPLERVIAHFLPWLFPGMEIQERAFFRLTRDADFVVSDEADDLLEAMQTELRRRRFGDVVRLEASESMSEAMITQLEEGLRIGDEQVYPVRGLLDLSSLREIASLDRPDLKYEPWVGVTRRPFTVPDARSLFATIRRSDALVQLPYDSFASSVEAFVAASASDPQVSAIKTTVYRTSDESALAPALIAAAESGKQTVCLVELKARFDESRNIQWSNRLEQAGVHVVHGFSRLKIHAKTTLVVRRDPDGLRRYAHIGTGNYHAVTARLYEDFGLFTADEEITADVADLFNYLTGFGRPQRFRKLLVAPFNLRERIVEEIRAVAAAAAAGEKASIRLKVNALHDEQMIEELYRASQAGASIDVVTRRISGLRPGVKGLSENVRVRSVLGRFLEHSRFFVFRRGGESHYFLGSADLLPRNLDHRIEVVVPIEARPLQGELDAVFDALLLDNSQSWELSEDGSWRRVHAGKGERRRTAQGQLMSRARSRARRIARASA